MTHVGKILVTDKELGISFKLSNDITIGFRDSEL